MFLQGGSCLSHKMTCCLGQAGCSCTHFHPAGQALECVYPSSEGLGLSGVGELRREHLYLSIRGTELWEPAPMAPRNFTWKQTPDLCGGLSATSAGTAGIILQSGPGRLISNIRTWLLNCQPAGTPLHISGSRPSLGAEAGCRFHCVSTGSAVLSGKRRELPALTYHSPPGPNHHVSALIT